MSLIEVKKDFTKKELLWFGPLFALFVGIVGGILIHRFQAETVAYGIWTVAAILIAAYYLLPSIRRPVYLGWMYAVMPIGWVVSHVLLAMIFFLVVTPIGLMMRLFRYDPMKRKLDRSATTYWLPRRQTENIQRYFKQH